MKDKQLLFDRKSHVLYSKPCKKEIQAKIALHYPEAEQETGQRTTPQRTWWDEKALANRFACEIAALIRVYEVLGGA